LSNNDAARVLNNCENALRVKQKQVQDGQREVSELSAEVNNIERTNARLDEEVEFCRRHLENLGLLNSDLVMRLEKYSEDDEIVRNLIDRRKRVNICKEKVLGAGTLLQMRM
jgi:predicted RNase H-like nuclease (RuvC/YqgF family)